MYYEVEKKKFKGVRSSYNTWYFMNVEEIEKDHIKELLDDYRELLKQIGVHQDLQLLPNDEGKIFLNGRRLILLDAEAFYEYTVRSLMNLVGERLAEKFVYLMGAMYGEKLAEYFLKMRLPRSIIPQIIAAYASVFTGWGVFELLKVDAEKSEAVVKIYNDFEDESAVRVGNKATCNFLRGVIEGVASKLFATKVHSSVERLDDCTVITVMRR